MKKINNIKEIMLIALVAISTMLTFSSCTDDNDLDSVSLHSFGPCPVLRGENIKVIGTGLNKVTAVRFPSSAGMNRADAPYVDVTTFQSQDDGTIVVTVPQESVPGHLKLVYSGGVIESKSSLSFNEPISIDEVSPLTGLIAGDVITVTGDYLYNISTATFADNVVVKAEEFAYVSRKKIEIKVPQAAVSGKLVFSDGGEVPTLIECETPLDIRAAKYISMSATDLKEGEKVVITGENLQLVHQIIFPGDITVAGVVSQNGTTLTTTVPEGTCSGVISLKQYSGAIITTDEFKVPTITYTGISPAKDLKVGSTVTIKGTNLNLVSHLILPTDIKLEASAFSVSADHTTLTFKVPEGMVDGTIAIVQNLNIKIDTEIVKMKKLGNVIWSGSINLGNWAANMEISKEKDQAIWDAFKVITGPGQLTVNFTEDAALTWWQIKPVYRSDWSAFFENVSAIVELTAGQSSWTVNITDKDVKELQDQGWALGGCNLTIESVEWKGANSGTTSWEGNLILDSSWGNNQQIPADAFAGIKSGNNLVFTYAVGIGDAQIKAMDGSWNPLSAFAAANQYACITVLTTQNTLSVEVNDADVTALKSSGMVLSGQNITITKVGYK